MTGEEGTFLEIDQLKKCLVKKLYHSSLYRPALKKELLWFLRLLGIKIQPQHGVTMVAPCQTTY
jgi:hypothetical protein